MIKLADELRELESETFEIEDVVASDEMTLAFCGSCSCLCSSSCSCGSCSCSTSSCSTSCSCATSS